MTQSVGVHEAKTHLSRLLEEVGKGETIEITNRGTVVARLVPPDTAPRFGTQRGKIWVSDDFDTLPDDILAMFES